MKITNRRCQRHFPLPITDHFPPTSRKHNKNISLYSFQIDQNGDQFFRTKREPVYGKAIGPSFLPIRLVIAELLLLLLPKNRGRIV